MLHDRDTDSDAESGREWTTSRAQPRLTKFATIGVGDGDERPLESTSSDTLLHFSSAATSATATVGVSRRRGGWVKIALVFAMVTTMVVTWHVAPLSTDAVLTDHRQPRDSAANVVLELKRCMRPRGGKTGPTAPHTVRARPFAPLDVAHCPASVAESAGTHVLALAEYELVIDRMSMDAEESRYFDLLDANHWRIIDLPFRTLASRILGFHKSDTGLDRLNDTSPVSRRGVCERLEVGAGTINDRGSMTFAIYDTEFVVNSDKSDTLVLRTQSTESDDVTRCSPTRCQPHQEQSLITINVNVDPSKFRCDFTPHPARPPVTYLLSRHNSANAWHSLIEHIYPQWIQMFLRGDFAYHYDEIAADVEPHYELLVYHETGAPNGKVFDHWWQQLLGTEIVYLPYNQRACCHLCILGPPKTATVYDYWHGSKFLYEPHSMFFVRAFRRHVFARLGLKPHVASIVPTYSFQQSLRNRTLAPSASASMSYILPDLPSLLDYEVRQHRNASFATLTEFDFTNAASIARTILITPNHTAAVHPSPIGASRVSDLPLVIFTRRSNDNERALKPFDSWLRFYQQPRVQRSLSYNLLLLYIEDLPLADQVTLLSRASMLVTVEGASEVNLLFLPLYSVVVEIECSARFYDGNRPRPWHQALSQYLGHLHLQWVVPKCLLAHGIAERLHATITETLRNKRDRNRYLYIA